MAEQKNKAGGEKKARTFDFMAMFQEARQTAMERTQGAFESVPETTENIDKSNSSSDDSDSGVDEKAKVTQTGHSKSKKSEVKTVCSNETEDSGEDMIGPPMPPGYGGQKREEEEKDEEEDLIGPPLPPEMMKGHATATSSKGHHSDEEDDEEEPEERLEAKIPSSHEISLNHGSKVVSALALDPAGARLVTGGHDFEVKFFDFAGMDASLQSFRSIKPCESHHIKQLQYSSTGDKILVVAGNAKAKVLDRDGYEVMECAKGDPYLVDMASTKGHTAMLNSGCWNPKIREEFMTCSNDGTLRLWDVNMEGKKHKNIMKPRSQQGRKITPTTCAYSNDGKWCACACQDGSIQIWDHSKMFVSAGNGEKVNIGKLKTTGYGKFGLQPIIEGLQQIDLNNKVNVSMMNRNCHMNGSDTSCLCFSYDGRVLASRGGDDTLKLWDMRNFKKPLNVKENLFNLFPVTDCVFSPDDRMIITGTSVKKSGNGQLYFLERETLNTISTLEFTDTSVVRSLWHPKLNQIVVGCGDGQVRLFYDPDKSQRGAMLCVVKQKRKARQDFAVADQQIITPYALPMFRQGRPSSTKTHEEKIRKDPLKSKRPDLPIYGPGEGGRVGAKGATLSQYVVQSLVKRKPDKYENDPRTAILRHAKEAAENPFYIDRAYNKSTHPTLLKEEEEEKEEDDEPEWKKTKIG